MRQLKETLSIITFSTLCFCCVSILFYGCITDKETLKTKSPAPDPPDLCSSKDAITADAKGDTCKSAKRTAQIDALEEAGNILIGNSSDRPEPQWYGLVLDNFNYNLFNCSKMKTKTSNDNKCEVEITVVVNKKNLNKALDKYFFDNPRLKSKYTKISWKEEDFSSIRVFVFYGSKILENCVPETSDAAVYMKAKIGTFFSHFSVRVNDSIKNLPGISNRIQEEWLKSEQDEEAAYMIGKNCGAHLIILLTLRTIEKKVDTERFIILEDALIKAYAPGTNELVANVSGKAEVMSKSIIGMNREEAIGEATKRAAIKITNSSILTELEKKIAIHLKKKRSFEITFQNIDKHRLDTIKNGLSRRNDLKYTSNIQAGNISILEVTTSHFNADGISSIIDSIMNQNGIETNELPVIAGNSIKYRMENISIVDEKILELVGQLNSRITDKKFRIKCSQCTDSDEKTNNDTKRITQKLHKELNKHFNLYIVEDYRDFSRSIDYVDGKSVPDAVIDAQHMLNTSDEPDALLKCELSKKQEKNIMVINIIKNEGEETITVSTEW